MRPDEEVVDKEKVRFVADKARDTFLEIKRLRKTMPQRTKAQRDELELKIKEEHEKWWTEIKHTMGH